MPDKKDTKQSMFPAMDMEHIVYSKSTMEVVLHGLKNIREMSQDPETVYNVPGEVDTLIKIMRLEKI